MNLSVHHVSNNFDNGWGFYIDLESLKPVLPGDKYYLEPIYEEPKIDEFGAYIVRVGSTTIITAVITYAMLFLF